MCSRARTRSLTRPAVPSSSHRSEAASVNSLAAVHAVRNRFQTQNAPLHRRTAYCATGRMPAQPQRISPRVRPKSAAASVRREANREAAEIVGSHGYPHRPLRLKWHPCPLEAPLGLLEIIHVDGGRHETATRRVGVER